ncbi:hypothetical protein MRB53_036063 [Persea americana]|uniref:Uncharacterized protein n=1 Tax=Persea americana TaxID=3435 RepID=A0ACC2K6J0_PERAE|nr:hypothetical protein MRB53_036063 [Persea americana]|eukprot:TRINITY_DN8800_c0_g2_i2.p1 TRINITY_DN8800_c0_g2~~TRINITY_DN8800_c0_g2_i2.p1  ORF type:complete len:151 (-),score=15.85 TRINITY_DN8800_c0_g2_i2:169-621(-)
MQTKKGEGRVERKVVTMILYEVLQLYPPAAVIARSTYKNVKLKFIMTLKLGLAMRTNSNQRDSKGEFQRLRSTNQVVFISFGWCPRICVGQNFTMIEAKMALAMILQRFSFELSPSYTHAPCRVITLQPQHGAQIILRRVRDLLRFKKKL